MIYVSAFEIVFDRADYIVQSVKKFAYKAFVFAYYSVNEILVIKQFLYKFFVCQQGFSRICCHFFGDLMHVACSVCI